MKLILFVVLLIFVTSSHGQVNPYISCSYSVLPGVPYTCTLTILNPDGRDNFFAISGAHASGRSNADVLRVISAYGNTLNIPAVICRQFPNLKELQFDNSGIEILTSAALSNCGNLTNLLVVKNKILGLPVDLFNGAPLLQDIYLYENSIQIIESGIFDNLTNLKTLSLKGNDQIELPLDIFERLNSLEVLDLFWCNLRVLQPQWFANLTRLRILRIQNNFIEDLPDGIFANSSNLLEVVANNNELKDIRAASFPETMANLNRVLFHNNSIASIDPLFFEHAPNLYAALFAHNLCVNNNVTQFNTNREESLENFIDCFEAFNPPRGICKLYDHEIYGYTCELFDVVYKYSTRSFTLTANHTNGQTDADVTGLIFTTSSLERIPQIIFQTFTNLRSLQARQSGLAEVSRGTFEGCVDSLNFIDVSYNCIKEVGGDAFSECANVTDIRLNHNCIYSVRPCKTFFVNKLANLHELNMSHNVCVDQNYGSIDLTVKDKMKVDMKRCFGMWYD